MARLETRLLSNGHWECEFIGDDGKTIVRKTGLTSKMAEIKVYQYINDNGLNLNKGRYSHRGKYGPRDKSVEHAQWGRPTKRQADAKWFAYRVQENAKRAVAKQRQDWENVINAIFDEIQAKAIMAGSAASAVANVRITEQTAKHLLERMNKAKSDYNVYTGNLDRAFKATIIQGRKSKLEVFLDDKDAPVGNRPEPSPRSGKQRVWIFKKNHDVGTIRENSYKFYMRRKKDSKAKPKTYGRVQYRYFKPWELKNGYRHRGLVSDRGGNASGFQYSAGGGYAKGTVQSGIILENTAPYAGAVAAKGYQVMPKGALLRSYNIKSKQQAQFFTITKDMLRAAKLI